MSITREQFPESLCIAALGYVSKESLITKAVVFYQQKRFKHYRNRNLHIDYTVPEEKYDVYIVFRAVCMREMIRVKETGADVSRKVAGVYYEVSGNLRLIKNNIVGSINVAEEHVEPITYNVNEGFHNLLETGVLLSSLTSTFRVVKVESIETTQPTPQEIHTILSKKGTYWYESTDCLEGKRIINVKSRYFSEMFIPKGKAYRVSKSLIE